MRAFAIILLALSSAIAFPASIDDLSYEDLVSQGYRLVEFSELETKWLSSSDFETLIFSHRGGFIDVTDEIPEYGRSVVPKYRTLTHAFSVPVTNLEIHQLFRRRFRPKRQSKNTLQICLVQ